MQLALTLLRWMGSSLDEIALRELALWRALVEDSGGDPRRVTTEWLSRSMLDTEALAVTLVGEPVPVTEAWVLDVLSEVGIGIGELLRFTTDLEEMTSSGDLLWKATERHITSDLARRVRFFIELLSVIGLISRHTGLRQDAEDEEDHYEDWSIRWSSLRALLNDPSTWLNNTLAELPTSLPLVLVDLLQDVSLLQVNLEEPRPHIELALRDAGIDTTNLSSEVSLWLPALLDDGTNLLAFKVFAAFADTPSAIEGVALGVETNTRIDESFAHSPTEGLDLTLTVSSSAGFLAGISFFPDAALFARADGEIGLTARLEYSPRNSAGALEVGMPVLPTLDNLETFATLTAASSGAGPLKVDLKFGFDASGEVIFDAGSAFPIDVANARLAAAWAVSLAWDSSLPGSGLTGGFQFRVLSQIA